MEKYELPMVNIHFSKRLFEVTFKRPGKRPTKRPNKIKQKSEKNCC